MEEFNFKTQYDEHGVKLLEEIFNWFVKKTLPDVVLHVENQPIEAHKLILGASSTFFKSIFCTRERKDFYFEDISYRTMKAIVEYMYTGELIVEWALMPECLKLADCLMIRGLSKLYCCEKVVSEPAPVSQEMLDAIEAISHTRTCALNQFNESNEILEGSQDAWQKQENLPKLQLKRDAKTGNWIPKLDELPMEQQGNSKAKPSFKRKSTEPCTRESKLTKCLSQNEDFENMTKEIKAHCDSSLYKRETISPIKDQETSRPYNNCLNDLKPTTKADYIKTEQEFEINSQELVSNTNSSKEIYADNTLNGSFQTSKTKHGSSTLATSTSNNLNHTWKKRSQEQNGRTTTTNKTSKNIMPGKELTDTNTKPKGSATALRHTELKPATIRRNKQKQKAGASTSSTASKATDLLIKKLFNERSFQRSSEPSQQNNSKSPKQSTVTTNSNTTSRINTNNNLTALNNTNNSQTAEEFENGKVIKSEAKEIKETTTTATASSRAINRLPGRCKVSDWHIDESEVLECDEEYEQHKNAPCPQPAEFLKTEKLVYGCPSCNKAYTLKSNYRRHYVVTHRRQDMPVYKCPICDSRFTRTDNRNSHIRKIHDFADPLAVQAWNQPFYMCALCKKGFYNDNDLQNHLKTIHPPSKNSYFGRIA